MLGILRSRYDSFRYKKTIKTDVNIKSIQRIMSELGFKSEIVKKFKHHITKVKIEDKDNI